MTSWGEGGGQRTQTLKLRFLYVTDSTLKPIVGIVVTTSPICTMCQQAGAKNATGRGSIVRTLSLYRSVVFPALS